MHFGLFHKSKWKQATGDTIHDSKFLPVEFLYNSNFIINMLCKTKHRRIIDKLDDAVVFRIVY